MQKAKSMWLFTNRNCLVFDENGEQIVKYQRDISCSHINKKIARQATIEAADFHLGKFREWVHDITREEMQFLLGVHPTYYNTKKW